MKSRYWEFYCDRNKKLNNRPKMKKLLKTRDKVLISLALLGDVALIAYVKGQGGYRKGSVFDFLDVKRSTLRPAVYQALKTGEIEKVIKDGEPYFKIAPAGKEKLARYFPIYKLAESGWDGKWRVVIFDIPEIDKKSREYLRWKLLSWGFGMLQKSVYISPLDVLADLKEYLRSQKLYGKVVVFEAREVFTKDQRTVAGYVWKLDKLNERYLRLINLIYSKNECDDKEWRQRKKEIKKEFFKILIDDPILPKELLPEDWCGDTTKKLITGLI